MIFFWSDTHFNHEGIIKHCGRPYKDVHEMNQELILRWNDVVGPSDTIYLLGDFAFKHPKGMPLPDIFACLLGHKHLIVGNHDERNPAVLKLPWESISHLRVVKEKGRRAVLCHFPIESWYGAHRGVLHFHGHCHGSLKRVIAHRFDVGADVFVHPISFDDLWERADAQIFAPSDHHGDL